MKHQAAVFWIVGAIILSLLPGLTLAQSPGELDPGFDGDGKVITDFGNDDKVYALVLQPDDKIIAAGQGDGSFALARYGANGSPDSTFNGDGKVTTSFPGGLGSVVYALALQPNGKILAAGTDYNGFVLVRYHTNGSLDATFDGDGKLITNVGNGRSVAKALTLQKDGKILVAGISNEGSSNSDLALARYNPDGSLDSTFDGDGKLTTDFSNGGRDWANALTLQPDGKILAAGVSGDGSGSFGNGTFALARYNANGSLDSTFGDNGKVTGPLSGTITALALQPNGKIVVGGSSSAHFTSHGFLARYNPNGNRDPTFGDKGIVEVYPADLYAVALQPDSKIVVALTTYSPPFPQPGDIVLARYYSNGSLDPTFDEDGRLYTDINEDSNDVPFALIIQPDDKLVAGGFTNSDFVLVRYFAPNPLLGPIQAYFPLILKQ